MEEEFRPAFKEVVLAYALAALLIWMPATAFILLSPLPRLAVGPISELIGLAVFLYFAFQFIPALEYHAEERYYLGDGVLRIQRNWVFQAITIPLPSITTVAVETPLLLRALGVGTLQAYTTDGFPHPLYNLKDAKNVAEKIRPKYRCEGVCRPSVG